MNPSTASGSCTPSGGGGGAERRAGSGVREKERDQRLSHREKCHGEWELAPWPAGPSPGAGP